ncbi:3-deoxy-D-manno-octulosonic acid kinase [Vibrio sp. SS-MA-C1-2]|uniref:3-deoxy-D-manno-octulosonic acid kinase n=1 Tax=Vibrio sp. SS-MA-C1-2 TaxID=2908646 RepID=UPI001F20B0A1|nr:3-deoxy-D-manno-octulosonic acid kinase [Vibrio sp. SS-MA-C1-2]UJF19262.1 3-deoxy-D-manno-octulosonic acid kinase [Vibrio sp. SS-MA-C1-2]
MEQQTIGNQVIWFNRDLLTEDPAVCFEPQFWQQQNRVIGSAQGRGTTWFVRGERIEMALRHYRRGGLFGRFIKDSYIFSDWQQTRPAQELALMEKLVEGGVRVPRPVAGRAIKSGLFYRADLLVEKIANGKDLVGLLQLAPLSHDIYVKIGEMVRKMHDLGVCHTDLNSHNILLDDQQQVWIIDFDKCGEKSGEGWKSDNLARLKRSFIKEQGKRNIHWSEPDWQALVDGYNLLT